MVCVVSHDRYFLNRVCTDILAFEGDGRIRHSVGDYDYYLEKKQRAKVAATRESAAILSINKSAMPSRDTATSKIAKPRKLSFKEQRELEGMEAQIHAVEAEVARIKVCLPTRNFFAKMRRKVNQLTGELDAAKEKVLKLYARWEELEAIRMASGGTKTS